MKLQLIRHATLAIEYGGLRIVVDPMLSEPEANPPIANTPNARHNPLVPMPVQAESLANADLLIVTHLHQDHWDAAAATFFDKNLPLLCQPGDEPTLHQQGFSNAIPVQEHTTVGSVTFHRTGGRHGTGEIGLRMGQVSGFVFKANGEPTLYIAGDTIYCAEVEEALSRYRPEWTVVNAGAARFLVGDPITMTADDVAKVSEISPATKVVAVHMEAINHCLLMREELESEMERRGLTGRVVVPNDGEVIRP
ncbi:MBL fold metallo-hydrolase [Cohnella candidum]|uniref:MBL fold metallo-hydrolase n=1 Tax=Cohnella candidum TaxID=2674991 RepID=A0A3G3K0W9_9BACL|nr:MBL fold metallo-hydrolase [Cohnella candidum]AYQ73801.1 MBL fold metallo-hydrolase [Cohnella candidum]